MMPVAAGEKRAGGGSNVDPIEWPDSMAAAERMENACSASGLENSWRAHHCSLVAPGKGKQVRALLISWSYALAGTHATTFPAFLRQPFPSSHISYSRWQRT